MISLDFELLWGVRDHADQRTYGQNIFGARQAVPRILELFARQGLRATWATVGFLFCGTKEELVSALPEERPAYVNRRLSSYTYLDEVGKDERSDPYYFAASLVDAIHKTPCQELATHTLSHFYCLEDGQTISAFEADLLSALRLADDQGISLKSIVFPRNQFTDAHLAVCALRGITHFRGNSEGWAYRAAKGADQTPTRRALRLIDAYSGILGSQTFLQGRDQPVNVPASRFLRPCAGHLAPLQPLHLATIKRGMTVAAQTNCGYHLWWHPHNFGANLDANTAGLEEVIAHFVRLQDRFGMQSCAMADF